MNLNAWSIFLQLVMMWLCEIDPLKAPGKLRSDLELTVGWMFAQGGPQAWALGIISCLQHLIFHHSLALVAFKNPATVYAWKKN